MKATTYIRLIVLIAFLLISNARLYSQKVSPSEAIEAAAAFLKISKDTDKSKLTVADSMTMDNQTLFYHISVGNQGFILISADKRAFPVLAYSQQNDFNLEELPDHVNEWIGDYALQIAEINSENNHNAFPEHPAWSNLQNIKSGSGELQFTPLTLSNWHQGVFYNDSCPAAAAGPNGRTYAGCVPVAMAQLIYYHRSPSSGTGTHSYTLNNYGILKANFESTIYNYDGMLIRPDRHNTFLPQLIYHCGVAVEASFSPTGTGAQTEDIPAALIQYFGYQPDAEFLVKSAFADPEWKQMLRNNIDSLHPVIYKGSSGWLGHAWVCDGYEEDFFHFNWGWGGFANGFYYLENLAVGGNNFSSSQGAIFGLAPPPVDHPQELTISTTSGTLCNPNWPNAEPTGFNATRVFNPGSSYTTFQLIPELIQLFEGDTIRIYEGTIATGLPLHTLTSDTEPSGIHLNSGANCLTSISNSGEARWSFSFLAGKGSLCPQNAVIRSINGTIYDGSGNFLMRPDADCSWLISPLSAEIDSVKSIKIKMGSFDLMPEDTLFFYDGPSDQHPLLVSFAGTQTPWEFESSVNKVLVKVRISPESMLAQGFHFSYTSVIPEYCNSVETLTARDGTISNGSNGYNYLNNSLCQWLLEPPDLEGITFTFNKLDTEPNRDRLEFYNAATSPETLIKLVSGNQIPEPFTIKGGKVRVVFRTDQSIVGKGFEMSYYSQIVGLEENHLSASVIYPNPVSSILKVILPERTSITEKAFKIADITGRECGGLQPEFNGESVSIDVSALSPGLYILSLETDFRRIVHRFIKY
jgi:hypothetical protein